MNKSKAREVLGVEEGASKDEIEERRRDLIKKTHPDQGGTDELLKKVEEAYEVLTSESTDNKTESGSDESVNRTTTDHNQAENHNSHRTRTSSESDIVGLLGIQDKRKAGIAVIVSNLLVFLSLFIILISQPTGSEARVILGYVATLFFSVSVGGFISGWYRLSILVPLLVATSCFLLSVVMFVIAHIFSGNLWDNGNLWDEPIRIMGEFLGPAIFWIVLAYVGAGFAVGISKVYSRLTGRQRE